MKLTYEIGVGGPCLNCTRVWPLIPGNEHNSYGAFCSEACQKRVIDRKFIKQLAAKILEDDHGTE